MRSGSPRVAAAVACAALAALPVAAAQLFAALLAFVVGAVLLQQWSRGAARAARGGRMRSPKAPPQPRLDGWRAWIATLICAAPIVIGLALPLLLLGRPAPSTCRTPMPFDGQVAPSVDAVLQWASVRLCWWVRRSVLPRQPLLRVIFVCPAPAR